MTEEKIEKKQEGNDDIYLDILKKTIKILDSYEKTQPEKFLAYAPAVLEAIHRYFC